MASVTAITIPHLARVLAAAGCDVTAVLGADATRDVRYQDRVPLATVTEAWERAVALTGRRDLPAVAAAYAEPDERSLVAFVVANQRTFGAGIDRFQRYGPTISDAYRWAIREDADELRLVLAPTGPIDHAGFQLHVEFELLDMLRSVTRITDRRAVPRALRFLHAGPPAPVVAAYAALVEIEPEFGCERCELVYPIGVRALALPAAKPALAAAIESQLDAMLAAAEHATPTVARARAAIAEQLARGAPLDVDVLARALAMSRRSLERALADEHTSATELIDDERKHRALAWLPTLSVEEVAARLGYSDARAFARAFKRWTGLAPSQARAIAARR